MTRTCRWGFLLLAAALVWPAPAADDKDDDPRPTERERLYWTGEIAGKLTKLDLSARSFTLHVEYRVLERKDGYKPAKDLDRRDEQMIREQRAIYRLQQKILEGKSSPEQVRRLRELASHQHYPRAKGKLQAHSPFRIATKKMDVNYKMDDAVKVRVLELPAMYDEKGHILKPTRKEIDDLKGPDKRLPGYTSDLGKLRTGDIVKVYLRKDSEDKDRPEAVMILVLEESKEPDKGAKKPKKNK